MKFYQFIAMSAMAALAITGCNKNETEAPVDTDPDAGVKEITISINGAGMTKHFSFRGYKVCLYS